MRKDFIFFVLILVMVIGGCVSSSGTGEAIVDPIDPTPNPNPIPVVVEQDPNSTMSTGTAIDTAEKLTAGEWRDLDAWDYWEGIIKLEKWQKYLNPWGINTKNRYMVRVKNTLGDVNDLKVILKNNIGENIYTSKTNLFGIADLFANFETTSSGIKFPLSISVLKDNIEIGKISDINDNKNLELEITIAKENTVAKNIDIMFVLDTTVSMDDEFKYIKSQIKNVKSKIVSNNVTIRMCGLYFRDTGTFDGYIVDDGYNFTTNIDTVEQEMNKQTCKGGGGSDEALDSALEAAVKKTDWSDSALARLMFVITDAPPHNLEKNRKVLYASIRKASEKGIRIIPIKCSGKEDEYDYDKSAEFFLRTAAISTGGTYIFLTNKSGIGDKHTEATVGQYKNEYLDELLVRVIKEYSEK